MLVFGFSANCVLQKIMRADGYTSDGVIVAGDDQIWEEIHMCKTKGLLWSIDPPVSVGDECEDYAVDGVLYAMVIHLRGVRYY